MAGPDFSEFEDLAHAVDIDSVRPNPENPRTISAERFEALKRSLEAHPEHLWARPLTVVADVDWTDDGLIIAGNMRWRAAKELGWSQIPVVAIPLFEDTAREWMLRDNSEYGEWEEAELARIVSELREAGADLNLTGFEPADLKKLLDSLSEPEAPIAFPPVDDDLATAYRCPACAYEWSGDPRGGVRAPAPPVEKEDAA